MGWLQQVRRLRFLSEKTVGMAVNVAAPESGSRLRCLSVWLPEISEMELKQGSARSLILRGSAKILTGRHYEVIDLTMATLNVTAEMDVIFLVFAGAVVSQREKKQSGGCAV